MNNICRMNRLTPIQGFVRALPYRRAMPVNDHRALPYGNDNGFSTHILKKAESLSINSVGQRPTDKINKLTKTKLICLKKKQ